MGQVIVEGSGLGNALQEMLTAPDIVPGDQPSYELAKILWLYHPLGLKMVEGPIRMAQSQAREITVADGPEERCRDQFVQEWEALHADQIIYQVAAIARAYGLGSLALLADGIPADEPIDPNKLVDLKLGFNCFDPLNTAGSLVLNQDPNSIDFMKYTAIAVSGRPYHRSRTVTLMNERPVYIAYTASAFGFVGRSVFQRALFPLKSFVQTMVTDDLVVKKAGVFIAKLKTAGAIIDKIMQFSAGLKRLFVQQSTNGNVISIGTEEEIETLNMQNIDGAFGMARKDILENIATACDMPAILLKQETYAEGFGEGTEDSKLVAGYVDRYRREIKPLYDFMDRIVMYRAWNKEFFASIAQEFPEYEGVKFEDARFRWIQSFKAQWPSLLTEPESEKVKTDDVKLKAIIATVEVFGPMLDPENKATLVGWAQDNINENEMMFQSPLIIDLDALANFEPPQPAQEPNEPKPFAATDSARAIRRRVMRKLTNDELADLVDMVGRNPEGLPKPNGHGRHGAPMIPFSRTGRGDDAPFRESDHPREADGKFTAGAGGGGGTEEPERGAERSTKAVGERTSEAASGDEPAFQSKKENARALLEKGTTTKELLATLGWPSISVPAMAKSLGMNLEKVKQGKQTIYKGTPMSAAERKAANLMPEGVRRSGGPRARDSNSWSLLEFIADKGGISAKDVLAGDVRSSLGTKNKFIPGFGTLLRPKGIPLDRLRELAVEAGYLHDIGFLTEAQAETNVSTLLEAIDREARGGERVYRYSMKPEHVLSAEQEREQEENRRDLEERVDDQLASAGIGDLSERQRNRVYEIMEKEGITDPLEAVEREAMEWVNDASERGEAERILDDIPGWDVPDDTGPAPRTSGTAAPF